jgi:uncharacterized protein
VINSVEFARDGGVLQGVVAIASMRRLQDLLVASDGRVQVDVRGSLDAERRPWLWLRVNGSVQLRCQRCLDALGLQLMLENGLRLILPGQPWPEDELEPGSGEEADDAIEAEDALSVLSLVEDEILLALPFAPMHESCGLPGGGAGVQELPEEPRESAFSVLKVLKKH